jgi:uncharacterized protein YbcI
MRNDKTVNLELTVGQLERKLSQQIQALYKEKLGHQPSKVTCQLFDQKLAIVIENSITMAEQLLAKEGDGDLAEQVRSNLDKAIEPDLRAAIEQILNVSVKDLLSDATIETERSAIVAILDDTPAVRNIESVPKVKKSTKTRKDRSAK